MGVSQPRGLHPHPALRATLPTRGRVSTAMTCLLLRGRTLSFLREPQGADDHASHAHEEDGAVLVRDGRIVASGTYDAVRRQAGPDPETIDHRPHLIMPGFIVGVWETPYQLCSHPSIRSCSAVWVAVMLSHIARSSS